LVAIMNLT